MKSSAQQTLEFMTDAFIRMIAALAAAMMTPGHSDRLHRVFTVEIGKCTRLIGQLKDVASRDDLKRRMLANPHWRRAVTADLGGELALARWERNLRLIYFKVPCDNFGRDDKTPSASPFGLSISPASGRGVEAVSRDGGGTHNNDPPFANTAQDPIR